MTSDMTGHAGEHRPDCPCDLQAGDVMTRDVVTLSPDATIGDALALLRRRGIRHLPVVREGRCSGLVDARLVAAAQLADGDPEQRTVTDLMNHYVPQVTADADLARVARLVRDSGCDSVVVVAATGQLVGIVTAADLVGALAGRAVARSAPVQP